MLRSNARLRAPLPPWLVLTLGLLLATPELLAQSPSPSPSPAVTSADLERFSLKRRHVVLMQAALRRLAVAEERVARRESPDWPRLTAWLASVSRLDRELSLREVMLGIPTAGEFARRIELGRAIIRERVARLRSAAPAPLLADGAFEAPSTPPPAGQPATPAQARARLRATPVGSVQDLFGATAGLKKKSLPVKGSTR